jgi:poly(beta-D-mannuronate) lyase
LRAETPGKVVLTGSSSLTFSAPHNAAEGLLFQDGALSKGSVVTFRADHCRLSDTVVSNYNPPDLVTAYYWVFFEGSDNRVERCRFERKNHMGPLVGNAITGARRNTVIECHFRDIGSSHGRNGMEIFRIWGYGGNEELGEDGAFFTIERNLFEHADGESMEIISLKSNRNKVVGNTIRATLGGITNRSGNFNTISGNIIDCEGRKGAYGMRVTGQRQRVSGNYISHCDYGIMLVSGEFIDRDLTGKYSPVNREGTPLGRVPRYGWVRESEFSGNTFVDNSGPDLTIGGNYKSGWPGSQRILIPEDNLISGNVIVKTGGGTAVNGAAQDRNPPLDGFSFKHNRFANNIVFGGEIRLNPMPDGFASPRVLTPDDVGPRKLR